MSQLSIFFLYGNICNDAMLHFKIITTKLKISEEHYCKDGSCVTATVGRFATSSSYKELTTKGLEPAIF